MAKIITVTNQKGGVGKTTTSLNLCVGLREKGKKVLLIDLDPQCSLTYIMDGSIEQESVYELLLGECTASAAIQKLREGDLIAANPALSTMDIVLNMIGREYRLKKALKDVRADYDYIILDSPPTLGILTINALTAADSVVIPALADVFSLQGIGQLYTTIEAVREYSNPGLEVDGILLIRHTDRYLLHRSVRQMLEDTAAQLQTRVYGTSIREAVTIREAQAQQKSIFAYAPTSNQANDYRAFVEEFCRE